MFKSFKSFYLATDYIVWLSSDAGSFQLINLASQRDGCAHMDYMEIHLRSDQIRS